MSDDQKHTNYPSRYAIGDEVDYTLNEDLRSRPGEITAVRFTKSKVWYTVLDITTGKTLVNDLPSDCISESA